MEQNSEKTKKMKNKEEKNIEIDKEKLKELTWKYFLEQKKKEVLIVLFSLFIAISFVGLISQVGWIPQRMPDNYPTCDLYTQGIPLCPYKVPYEPHLPYWLLITGLCTTAFWIIFGIIYGLKYWIESNWKKAEQRAKGELNIK